MLAIYRDVEVGPDHPLTETLAELARHPVTRQLSLRGLDEEEGTRYIETVAGTAPGRSVASSLHRQTNGNLLFLGEAVRLLVGQGRLEGLTDVASVRITVPPRIREVIARRLGQLSQRCRETLVLGSVLGREFALEPIRSLGETYADEALEVLGEAVAAGLLMEAPGGLGRFRFSHDLVRETLYEEPTPARRIRLHRKIAEVLEVVYAEDLDEHLAELAHHSFEGAPGGDPGRAVGYARRAADQAVRSLAYEEAARLYQMALQALELDEHPDQGLLAELLLAMGEARARAGDLMGAKDLFLRAASIARRTGAADQLARAPLGYGGRFAWVRAGNDPHLVPMLQDALVLLGGSDDALRVRLLGRLACALRSSPDREHSAALSHQALEIARRLGDPSTLAYALTTRFAAVWWPENPEERLEIARELLRVAEAAQDPERIVDGRITSSCALSELGAMAEARSEIDAMAKPAEALRQPAWRWLTHGLRAEYAVADGAFDVAEELIDQALRYSPTTLIRDNVSAATFQLFLLRRAQGRVEEMEEAIWTAVEEFSWYPVFRLARACLLLDTGRTGEARSAFGELARDGFRGFNRDNYWVLNMSLAGEVCAELGDVEVAGLLYDELLPFAGRQAIGHPEGSIGAVDRYLGLLARTLDRLDEADAHFRRAAAANERMGARPWVAHTQHDHARMLLARDGPGDRDRALELLASCHRTARQLGMVALEGKCASLLEELGAAPTRLGAPPATPARGTSVFRREGEYWSIVFEAEAFRLRDAKGLRYLSTLLASPGKEIHVLDLVTAEGGIEPHRPPAEVGELSVGGPGDAGEVLDAPAREAYRRRLVELEEELEEARAFGDAERAARAEEERDFLARELASAMGFGGRSRVAASASERARVNVTRAIRSSLARIGEHSPSLGKHLRATVRTGTFCSYTPDPLALVDWRL